jgi:CBS domain-containing protein
MSEDIHASTLQLRVYARQVYSGDGTLSGEMRVFCPDKTHSVTLEHCTACARWAGLHFGPKDRTSFLECTGTPQASVPASSLGTRVSDVMTPSVVCVRPDLSIQAVHEMFLDKHIRAAPVIDDHGKPIGMVSQSDLLAARNLRRSMEASTRLPEIVEGIMTPLVFALREHASLSQAAGLMAIEGVHHIMVVAANGEIVGVLSAVDVLRWVAERDGYLQPAR